MEQIIAIIIGLLIGAFIGRWIYRWQKRKLIEKSEDFKIAKDQLTRIVSGVGEMLAKDYEEQGDQKAADQVRESFNEGIKNIKVNID